MLMSINFKIVGATPVKDPSCNSNFVSVIIKGNTI